MMLIIMMIPSGELTPSGDTSSFSSSVSCSLQRSVVKYNLMISAQLISSGLFRGMGQKKKKKKRVQLGHCASLLAPSSTAGWVSCNEEVAKARAHYNLIIEIFTQSAVPLYCHLVACY